MDLRIFYAAAVLPHASVPATVSQRLLGGMINASLVCAVCALVPLPPAGRVGAGAGVILVCVVSQALTGAGPGGAVCGTRLRRTAPPSGPPGRAALKRAGLLLIASLATLGAAPLIMVARTAGRAGWETTWFDRVSTTSVVSTRSRASYTLVIEGRPLALRAPTVLGRDPEALPEFDGAQLLAVLPEETTLSKTHALLEPTLSGVIVTDLRSTNRTFVVEVGHFRELVPGRGELVARGSTVYFGQAECSIR